ncbi:MAG: hypothetical protein DDT31_01737 [Syntrophomonadaceae bacterium]|nr:hypothetical protein [Bacillota bacterium]
MLIFSFQLIGRLLVKGGKQEETPPRGAWFFACGGV